MGGGAAGSDLAERLDTYVWVDNDCHVQALAERHFGLGQEVSNFASVQSGIGLSAAFYFDGALYRGHSDTAGEIGHMTVVKDGLPCACGNWGCWETVASTTHLLREAYSAAGERLPAWVDLGGRDALSAAEARTIRRISPPAPVRSFERRAGESQRRRGW